MLWSCRGLHRSPWQVAAECSHYPELEVGWMGVVSGARVLSAWPTDRFGRAGVLGYITGLWLLALLSAVQPGNT